MEGNMSATRSTEFEIQIFSLSLFSVYTFGIFVGNTDIFGEKYHCKQRESTISEKATS